jgi:hypothetical protein
VSGVRQVARVLSPPGAPLPGALKQLLSIREGLAAYAHGTLFPFCPLNPLWSNGNELERMPVSVQCQTLHRAQARSASAEPRKHTDGLIYRRGMPALLLCRHRAEKKLNGRRLSACPCNLRSPAVRISARRPIRPLPLPLADSLRRQQQAHIHPVHTHTRHPSVAFRTPSLPSARSLLPSPSPCPRYVPVLVVALAPRSPPCRTVHRTGRRTTIRTHEPDGGRWCVEHE